MTKRRRKFSLELQAQGVLEFLRGVTARAHARQGYAIGLQLDAKRKGHYLENATKIIVAAIPPSRRCCPHGLNWSAY